MNTVPDYSIYKVNFRSKDFNTIIARYFNITEQITQTGSTNELNRNANELKSHLQNISSTAAKYAFFSSAHKIRDHRLGHKSSLKKFYGIKIIPFIFSEHSEIKLEINIPELPK